MKMRSISMFAPSSRQREVKCVGNLPYYVASQLLLKFIDWPSPISLFLFMLQKEMAQRLTAVPKTKNYGAMTVLVQAHYEVMYLRTVAATVFLPQPDVDSALIELRPRASDTLPFFHEQTLRELVTPWIFAATKTVTEIVANGVADWTNASTSIGFPTQARAEELSLVQWIALSNLAHPDLPRQSRRMWRRNCFPSSTRTTAW